jgi:hypothetical protein
VELGNGEQVKMKLAERETSLPKGLAIREVRKLGENDAQIAIVTTNRRLNIGALAGSLFARWSQENFFRYMRQHYALDALCEFGSEAISDTETTVNPAWRTMNNEVRKRHAELRKERARFAAVNLLGPLAEPEVARYLAVQAQQQEKIDQLQRDLERIKKDRKKTLHHIPVRELPEKDRFTRLLPERKHFIDTIKMLAYRAETSLVSIVRERLGRADDARALLVQLFNTEVDLVPDLQANTLTVKLHHLTQAAHDEAARYLCQQLNETETVFPDTHLRILFQVGSA